jgi:hypothetical protein
MPGAAPQAHLRCKKIGGVATELAGDVGDRLIRCSFILRLAAAT